MARMNIECQRIDASKRSCMVRERWRFRKKRAEAVKRASATSLFQCLSIAAQADCFPSAQWSSSMIRASGFLASSWNESLARGPGFNSRLGPPFFSFYFLSEFAVTSTRYTDDGQHGMQSFTMH